MGSSGLLTQPEQGLLNDPDYLWGQLMQVVGRDLGLDQHGSAVDHVSYDNDTTYAHTLANQGNGGHLNIPGELTVESDGSGTFIRSAAVSGAFSAGATTLLSLAVTTTSHLVGAVTADASLSVGTTLQVGTTSHLIGAVTADNNLTVKGNTALGDANGDTLTVIGLSTFKNAASSLTQLYIDAGNNRVIALSATALGSDLTPCLQVVGRLYVAPDAANDFALELRRSSAATVGWDLGVSSTNDLVVKDLTNTETFRAGAVASAYQATVTGKLHVTGATDLAAILTIAAGGATITGGIVLASSGNIDGNGGTAGQLRIGGVIVNAASFTSTEVLKVGGSTLMTGGLTLSGPSNIDGNAGVAGQIRIGAGIFGAASLSATEILRVHGESLLEGIVTATGIVQSASATATTAGGAQIVKLGASGPNIYVGSGVPTASAAQGSLYLRTDGSSGITRAYINTNGSTTWTAINTVA